MPQIDAYIRFFHENRIWLKMDSRPSWLPLPGSAGAPRPSAYAASSASDVFLSVIFLPTPLLNEAYLFSTNLSSLPSSMMAAALIRPSAKVSREDIA